MTHVIDDKLMYIHSVVRAMLNQWHVLVFARTCRSCHMGSLVSRTESEQCRIIVEDVTKLANDERSGVPTTSGVTTSGGVLAESRHSSVSSETAVVVGPMTRRGSLSPGGPNATASRRGSNSSWTSWGSGNGPSLVAERDCETQFWVPASVMQRSRARSLVPPSSDAYIPDVSGMIGCLCFMLANISCNSHT